jgi:aryl-alcohol dehydrogenase-like predicted oxidoreductase
MATTLTQTIQGRYLGSTRITVPPLGIGTNRWGAAGKSEEDIFQAFETALDAGTNLIDTAEMYTGGKSERLIGEFIQRDPRPVFVCTKFAPLPTRLSAKRLLRALDASLERLKAKSIDLYYVHFPLTFLSIGSLMDAMAEAVRAGKIRAVGVSNYSAKQMREAAERLARHGIPLAANEVHYSLLHRQPEANGVLDACRELDVALVAYFPLGAGLLKAPQPAAQQQNWMSRMMERRIVGKGTPEQLAALRRTLEEVARAHGGTATQAALNWLLQRDEHVIAIPGATSAKHARENAGTLSWSLTPEEFAAIDQKSAPWKQR